MRIIKLWIVTSFILGIGEFVRAWHGSKNLENAPKSMFEIRFWEILLSGNVQKIVMINFGCNLLFILGKWIQFLFLGRLRELEAHKSSDRIRDYVLMKTVFIGAIVGSGEGDDDKEIIIWFVWLTLVGFLKHFGLLCRDRLEYMTLSIRSSVSAYIRLITLLCLVSVGNIGLMWAAVSVFGCWSNCPSGGFSALSLLLFECSVIVVDAMQTTLRFGAHLVGEASGGRWERRGFWLFAAELACELSIQTLTLCHLIHVWVLHGLSLSLTDALLFIHIRSVVHAIAGRLSALRAYVTMDRRFRDATPEELSANDDHCSICHDSLSAAKVLPCGHLFHLICLRGWLEHSPTCPICRRPVQPSNAPTLQLPGQQVNSGAGAVAGDGGPAVDARDAARQMLRDLGLPGEDELLLGDDHAPPPNLAGEVAEATDGGGEHMIRRQSWTFGWGGGNGWASWLPRLSIEVVRQQVAREPGVGRRLFAEVAIGGGAAVGVGTGQALTASRERVLESAIAQVLGVLPELSPRAVRQDLLLTGDVQVTLERGLEGHVRFRSAPAATEAVTSRGAEEVQVGVDVGEAGDIAEPIGVGEVNGDSVAANVIRAIFDGAGARSSLSENHDDLPTVGETLTLSGVGAVEKVCHDSAADLDRQTMLEGSVNDGELRSAPSVRLTESKPPAGFNAVHIAQNSESASLRDSQHKDNRDAAFPPDSVDVKNSSADGSAEY